MGERFRKNNNPEAVKQFQEEMQRRRLDASRPKPLEDRFREVYKPISPDPTQTQLRKILGR